MKTYSVTNMKTSQMKAIPLLVATGMLITLALPVSSWAIAPTLEQSDSRGESQAVPVSKLSVTTSLIATGFDRPTSVVSAYDGTNRLFVAEQLGKIRLVKGSSVAKKSYLDIRGRISPTAGLDLREQGGLDQREQGLLGLAFSPKFSSSPILYFTYTNRSGALILAKVRAKSASATSVSAKDVTTILKVPHPTTYGNHNGGSVTFGRDGYLYLGTGDGGGTGDVGAGDPFNKALNVNRLGGKILRIDVTRKCGSAQYCVPASNPFAKRSGAARLVWALGVRNPWRITTDLKTGDLWVGDVGDHRYEEIDRIPRGVGGKNLGWSCMEGNARYNQSRCPVSNYLGPVTTLCQSHGVPGCPADRSGSSVTGGYVYRGKAYPAMQGTYLFGDFIGGNLYAYAGGKTAKVGELGWISSFGETSSREPVAVSYDGGLYRLSGAAR